MSKHKGLDCQTCGEPAPVLSQSYTSGLYECPPCALLDPSPFMSATVVARLKRLAQEQQTRAARAAVALRNFHQIEAVTEEVPA